MPVTNDYRNDRFFVRENGIRMTESRPFRGFIIGVILFAGVLAGFETNASVISHHGAVLNALDLVILGIFDLV